MDYAFLSRTRLFQGDSPQEIESMLVCLDARQKKYTHGATILHTGDLVQSMGLVLQGSVSIENDDFWGNHSILSRVEPGQVFAETYAAVPGEKLLVDVVAASDCEILFMNLKRMLTVCSASCGHHAKLIQNLVLISAQKNLELSRRILHTTPKSIRGRLLSYLSEQAHRTGKRDFAIPFSRQQLADYLNVDRSALSNELSKMQREGLIRVEKKQFRLAEQMELV